MVNLLCILGMLFIGGGALPMDAKETGMVVKGTSQRQYAVVEGKLISDEKQPLDYATVYLKGTPYGCMSDEQGVFRLEAPEGEYTLIVSAVGFQIVEKKVRLLRGERLVLDMMIQANILALDEVEVVSTGVSRVKRSAFNAVAVDTKELVNSTKNLSEALMKLPHRWVHRCGNIFK